jgi:hypothetical protein
VAALVGQGMGRLLVATAEHSPFAFFAWPADTSEGIAAGLRILLNAWPPGAPLTAEPALAHLDTQGRLQPTAGTVNRDLLLPPAASAAATALLALVVGAPGLLFAARAGVLPLSGSDGFVSRYVQRPGRIRLGSERIEVVLAADQIDLDLRRAGLDRDPSSLPWLRREVRFVYERLEAVADPRVRDSNGGLRR